MSGEPYIEYVFLKHLQGADFDAVAGDQWIRTEDLKGLMTAAIGDAIRNYDYEVAGDYKNLIEKHLLGLQNVGALASEGDDYTGLYSYLNVQAKDAYVRQALASGTIARRIDSLGDGALRRALSIIAQEEGWASLALVGSDRSDEIGDVALTRDRVPASDRIVTFTDNQVSDFDQQVTVVIDAVAGQNQLDNNPGVRELVLGQLKAGRELIRAGSFRVYLIELTMIETLRFLSKRYEKELIGGLAAALLAALLKHIGIGT